MWGYRMIVPSGLRATVLREVHSGHLGIVKSKGIARSFVWWPNIDADVEETCRGCETCALEATAPPRATPQPWPYHTQPWTRIHVDFLGPYQGKTYLVLVDSSSKWLELFEMSRTNASSVIKVLRRTFAQFGLPVELTSDQGPPFTSNEFKDFLNRNGVRQSFSPVYHPQSNGAAENSVKLCKRAIKKAIRDNVDVEAAIQTFLLAYRNSVHSTTGESPAMLLQRRSLRSRLDLLKGGLQNAVAKAQQRQVENAKGVTRELDGGDSVWVRDYGGKDKWTKGVITNKLGSRRFTVNVGNDNDQLITRHLDQIRRRSRLSGVACPTVGVDEEKVDREDVILEPSAEEEMTGSNILEKTVEINKETEPSEPGSLEESSPSSPPQAIEPTTNVSKRLRRKVDRFGYP